VVPNDSSPSPKSASRSALEVFTAFLRLGCSCFGGPTAHFGYFHDDLVLRRKWISDSSYAGLMSLCQFLPGPSSSQVGFLIGYQHAGIAGALAAWIGFTAPSAIIMICSALFLTSKINSHQSWIHGIKVAVVAVIAQAIWSMAVRLCPDIRRTSLAILTAAATLLFPGTWPQMMILLLVGIIGLFFIPIEAIDETSVLPRVPSRGLTITCWVVLGLGLILIPLLAISIPDRMLQVFPSFFRVGALAFGGGHVVLPLLQAEVAIPQGISSDRFLTGYGVAQVIPGPLFSFAAFLGTALPASTTLMAICTGLVALCAIFAPGLLIGLGSVRLFHAVRANPRAQRIIAGLNAGVVGLLLAAFYDPVFTSAILTRSDFACALLAVGALIVFRLSSVLVVMGCTLLVFSWSLVA